jgi:large subunit ribosomal protein L9
MRNPINHNTEILLLEDVDKLGRSGEIVNVKPGYARNYILPSKKGVIANASMKNLQKRLQEDRSKIAARDLEESQKLAESFAGIIVSKTVKVDPEGHMYGSVSATEILKLLETQNVHIDKTFILMDKAIKATGVHTINLRLKEGVEASFTLKILAEGGVEPKVEAPEAVKEPQAEAEEAPSGE